MLDRISLPQPIFASSPPPPGAVFFAAFPDPLPAAAKASLVASRLQDEHKLTGKPLGADRFHVTLQCIGHYPHLSPNVLEAAREAAASVAMQPFEVVFDRAVSFSGGQGKSPIVLCGGADLEALIKFQRILAIALLKSAPVGTGLKRLLNANFTPHMTLLYDHRNLPEQSVEPIRWIVRDFVLVHSHYGQHQHVRLGRWPLRG